MALTEGAGKEPGQGGLAHATGTCKQQAAPVALQKGAQILPHLPPPPNERLTLRQTDGAIANEHCRPRPGRGWFRTAVHVYQGAILRMVEQHWQRPLRPGIATAAVVPSQGLPPRALRHRLPR